MIELDCTIWLENRVENLSLIWLESFHVVDGIFQK
jgi:hypothetical protein